MGLKTAKAAVPSIDSLFVLKSLEEEVALIGADEALLLGGLRHGRLPLRPEDGANANCAPQSLAAPLGASSLRGPSIALP